MTLKSLTPLMVAGLAALSFAGSGCSSTAGNPLVADHSRNLLGIYKYEPGSYAVTAPTSDIVHANEVIAHPNSSGDRTTLLFGLITYEDY